MVTLLFVFANLTFADNTKMADVTIHKGEQQVLDIELVNPDRSYSAFQLDLKIPDGIVVATDLNGEPAIGLSKGRSDGHSFKVVKVNSDTYRLLAYSMDNKPFKGNSGSLATVLLETSEKTPEGKFIVNLMDQRFTDLSGSKVLFDDVSATIEVQEKPVIITATSYTRYYGDENPVFAYTTEGADIRGIPIISCDATPLSPIGDYPIKMQVGSVTNGNVTFVDGVLTIVKTPLTIIADNKTKKQGDDMPEFTASYSGFKNDEDATVLSVPPKFSCNADECSEPGSYDIHVFGAEATNYEINYKDGFLSVTLPDPIVVTVKQHSRLYGEGNPDNYEYTVEGGVLLGEPVITCTADEKSPVGLYDIIISKGTVTNYNVTFVNGVLSVNKAPLLVKADDKEMLIGNQVPVLTANYQGFKNDDSQASLVKKPEFTCDATSMSLEGSYPIYVFGAESPNYEFVYENGTLTVVDPPLVVKVISTIREYGEGNPKFEYVVEGGNLIGNPLLTCEAMPNSPVADYSIKISKGNVMNAHVTYIDGTLTVNKANLLIKAEDKIIRQDDEIPMFTASYEGFKLDEDETSLSKLPEFRCEANNSKQIGEFSISIFGAEATNYDISYVNGLLTIVERPITVRAISQVRVYGDPNPVFVYEVEGGKLYGEPLLRCEADQKSAVGEYAIVIEKGSVTNSAVTLVNGTLKIEKALLTVAADNKQVKYGDEMPEYTATYSGFKNNENPAMLEILPSFSCPATSDSEPGEYAIEVFGAYDKNYEFNYISGSLLITLPDPVVAEISNPIAGQLENQLTQAGYSKMKVNELKVNGQLNGTDIKCIREMLISGNLTDLDIQKTSIVKGGDSYYNGGVSEKYTENDVIGQFMFYNCKKLISIQLPNTVKRIEYAFSGCDNLLRIDIPESCEEIGILAIELCPSLTTITIPAQTKLFDSFNGLFCPSLTSIEVDPSNLWLTSDEGVLFTKDKTTLIKYPMGKKDESYTVAVGVVKIDDWAFGSARFANIILPDGLEIVGSSAFNNCDELTGIELPTSVRSIEMGAFSDCDKLERLSLPEGLAEIPSYLADYCKSLTRLDIPSTIQEIGYAAFSHCSSLSTINCAILDIETVDFDVDYESKVANAFIGIDGECEWHVPEGPDGDYYKYKKLYMSQPWWISSWKIEEPYIRSAVENVFADSDRIESRDGRIIIYSNSDKTIRIYTVNGSMVGKIDSRKGEQYQMELPRGIYIINNKQYLVGVH